MSSKIHFKKVAWLGAVSGVAFIALNDFDGRMAYAQSSPQSSALPPVVVQAPATNPARPRTTSSRGTSSRHAAVRRAPTLQRQAAAPVPYVAPSTSAIAIPSLYAGGQVASGGQLGMLGNRSVFNSPFSSNSYTAKLIQDQQARSIQDVALNDPSVRSAWLSGSYTDQFYIRGFPVGAADFSIAGLYGVAPYQYVYPGWVDRVEILHGPAALLNGMAPGGSIGGTINLIPKRAGNDPLTQLTTSYISRGQIQQSIDVGRRFGDNKEWGVRFNGTYKDGDTARDRTSQELGSAVLGVDYAGERVRVSADLGYQKQDWKDPARFTYLGATVPGVPAAPDGRSNWDQPWTFVNTQDTFGLIRGEVDIADNWTVFASFGGRRNDFSSAYGQSTVTSLNGNLTGTYYTQPTWTETYSGQTGVRGKFDTGPIKHEVVFGYSQLDQSFGSRFTSLPGTFASNIYNPVDYPQPNLAQLSLPTYRTNHLNLESYLAADTLSVLDDRIALTLGGRHQRVQSDNFDQLTGLPTVGYDKEKWSPSVGVVVKPFSYMSLYANYIEGLQQGPTAPAGSSNAGLVFPPIQSKQAEGGMKLDFGRFGTTLAYFEIEQPSGTLDPTTLAYSINGLQRNRGFEFNAFGELTPGLRLLGGFTIINGEIVRSAGGALDGKEPTGVPHLTANIGAEWDTPWVSGLTLTGRLIHTGSAYVNSANTQVADAWNRVDIGTRYTFSNPYNGKPITVRANIDNVFGAKYWSASQFSGMLVLGEPRLYRLAASFDF